MKNKYIINYYAILLLLVAARTSEAEPNIFIRIAFLSAFFLPIVLKYRSLLPACLTCFMTVGTYGFAYNYFPYQMEIYPIVCFTGIILSGISIKFGRSRNNVIVFFALCFVLLRDILDDGDIQPLLYSFLTILCMWVYIKSNKEEAVYYLLNCFVIAALVISILYFANYEKFLTSYNLADGMERSGWTDPNYLSCIIGMAIISSIILLSTQQKVRLIERAIWLSTAVLSFATQLLLASRGGILAVVAALVFMLLNSKTKVSYKILILLTCVIVVTVLYYMGYFSLIEYRMANDAGGGSGRIDIWADKLSYYVNSSNIFQILFGLGPVSALNIGDKYAAFHNDFVAILCGYGVVGFLFFVYMFIYPIFKSSASNKTIVNTILIYLAMCSITLEPFYSGRLTYFSFYLLALILALHKPLSKS